MTIINNSGRYDYTYVYHEDKLVARKNPDGSTWYYLNDHLGSTTVIMDEEGNVLQNLSYTPYGVILADDISENRLYTGQEYDEATGQMYYHSRYYIPPRFIQPDDLLPNLYDPQQLNRYAYARNNPYKYIDPSGHSVEAVFVVAYFGVWKGLGAIVTIAPIAYRHCLFNVIFI